MDVSGFLETGHAADKLYIDFNKFNESSANLLDFLGDAIVSGNEIGLTNISRLNGYNVTSSLGRVVYKQTISLWNANFTTHFQFLMKQGAHPHGEGLAFFFASPEWGEHIPYKSDGGGLGLFSHNEKDGHDINEGKTSNQVVAVEFDTYMNAWDTLRDNHVGIDVHTIVSAQSVAVKQSMNDGEIWDAWIDYDGEQNKLLIFLSNSSNGVKPEGNNPLLSYDIDLRAFLPRDVMIGFSAVSYSSTETHQLISWSFSSVCFSGKKRNWLKWVLVIVSVSFVAAILLCALLCWVYIRRNRASKQMDEQINRQCDDVQGYRRFTYRQLKTATMKFSEKRKLGRGGFGDVYKGVLLKTSEIVAVKRMSEGSNQGKKEYIAEINTITRLRHRNLVQLLGWCHEKGELLLVYEYMPNGSLDNFLFGKRRGELGWARRHRIACDIASALFYLHELWDQRVVHRDVKCSNIMLDSHFNAKLGDFGLARLVNDDRWSQTTTLAGTLGYIAPECAITGKASAESDVFSFGAVALEIACGKKVISFISEDCNMRLVEWVWDLYGKGRLLDAADAGLNGEFNREELEQLMLIGLWCSYPDHAVRPKMRQVLQILNFEAPLPHLPPKMPVPVYSPFQQGFFSEIMFSRSDCPPPFTTSSQEMAVFSSSISADQPTTSTYLLGH
ncbi:L-type lectin-domain containing receptor kinase IX.1 [Cryptomeria japonica]|uniref:L-type lectin-domain containing receptor kinase IX.1 n=1 Tax=Cryptomeria japonica TaxID=3369 RepID=UPI0025AD00D9|nr:L-type lectin-domain containing receptor kinase IX.1 [Cryptomeria japonica]